MSDRSSGKLSNSERSSLATALRNAASSGIPMEPLSASHPDMNVVDAYAIQSINIDQRRQEGATCVGHKIGITSKAVQEWLKVNEPDFGCLMDDMIYADGADIPASRLMQPRMEGEIAFVLGRDLKGPGLTALDVIRATDHLLPCIEIIDSRIRDWKFTYEDTVADNASSGLVLMGTRPARLQDVDLSLCGMALRKNGTVVSTGAGAACLGNPVQAVLWLAQKVNDMEPDGPGIPAGSLVLSGALGPVCPIEAGDAIEVEISGVGNVRANIG